MLPTIGTYYQLPKLLTTVMIIALYASKLILHVCICLSELLLTTVHVLPYSMIKCQNYCCLYCSLHNNQIEDAGAQAIVDGCKLCPNLQTIV